MSYNNRLFEIVDFDLNYTFTQLKNGNLVRLPKHALNTNLNYVPLKISLIWECFTPIVEKRQAVDLSTLEAYSLIDLRYAKSFYDDKLTASVWLSNILDTEFIEITNFTTKGRNFRIGLAYQF